MLRTVFHVLVVFLPMSVPSTLRETEPHGSSQDPCGELKQLRELVHQQDSRFIRDQGVFTAPVRGVYYIRFTAAAHNSNNHMGVELYKNNGHLMHLGDYDEDSTAKHVSGALALELEGGDVVYLRLLTNYALYDDTMLRCNTFNGFLVFPS